MHAAGVPTAEWRKCETLQDAVTFAETMEGKVAVKADGLAGGKGVIVVTTSYLLKMQSQSCLKSMTL